MQQPPLIRPATPDDLEQASAMFKGITVPQRELCLVAVDEWQGIVGLIRGVETKDKKAVIATPARLVPGIDEKVAEQMKNMLNGRLMLLEMPEMKMVSDKDFAKTFKENAKPKAKAKTKAKKKAKNDEVADLVEELEGLTKEDDELLTDEQKAQREQERSERKQRVAQATRKSAGEQDALVLDTTTLQDQDYLARIAKYLPAYPLRAVEIQGEISRDQLDDLLAGGSMHVAYPGTSGLAIQASDLDDQHVRELQAGQAIELLVGTVKLSLAPLAGDR